MKLKLSFLLIFLILILGLTKGQEPVIEFGPRLKKSLRKELNRHLHSDSSGHYLLFKSSNRTKLIIEKFGNDFKPLFSKKFPTKKTKIIRQHISFANGKFIWLYTVRNKKAKKREVFLSIIDLEGNIVQTKKIKSISSRKDEPWYHVTWTLSKDKSKLLISGRTSRMKKSTFDFLGWAVIVDENHDILWEKDFSLDYPSNLVKHKSWKVTNNAKAILATKIYTKGNKKRNDFLRFYSLTEEEDYLEPMELNPENEMVGSHKIIEKANGDLLGVGFIYNSIENLKVTGVIKFDIDGKDFSFKTEYGSFPEKSFKYGKNKASDSTVEDGINFLIHFKIKDIYFNENKEIVLVTEENAHTIKSVYDRKTSGVVRKNFYISNQIGVVTLSDTPEVLEVALFPKKQTFVDVNYFTSHAQLKTKVRPYYIYNDHKKNLDDDLTFAESYKCLKKQKNLIPMFAYIDKNGALVRQQLFSRKKIKESIMPHISKQIGPNKLLIVCYQLSVLKFEYMRLGIVTIN